MVLPIAAFQLPAQVPSLKALGAVATLALAGTSLASWMYYWLLTRVGAAKTLLVTYLLPGFALIWGALLLKEVVTVAAIAGLALILMGITITSGRGAGLAAWLLARVRRLPAS
jgi:drug/metabolite transporter (DMT)-like permease